MPCHTVHVSSWRAARAHASTSHRFTMGTLSTSYTAKSVFMSKYLKRVSNSRPNCALLSRRKWLPCRARQRQRAASGTRVRSGAARRTQSSSMRRLELASMPCASAHKPSSSMPLLRKSSLRGRAQAAT